MTLVSSAGGIMISNSEPTLFSRMAFTDAVTVPSGELVATATAAGVVGAPAVLLCWLQPIPAAARAARSATRLSEVCMVFPQGSVIGAGSPL